MAAMQTLFPFQKGKCTYAVSPLVTMQMISHHERRHQEIKTQPLPQTGVKFVPPEFVAGFLFGFRDPNTNRISVSTSSAIPVVAWQVDSDGNRAFITDSDSLNKVIDLHFDMYSNDRLVGVYFTGGQFDSAAIPGLMNIVATVEQKPGKGKRMTVAKRRRIPVSDMLCLVVDTQLRNDVLSLVGFVREPITDPIRQRLYTLQQRRLKAKAKQSAASAEEGSSSAPKESDEDSTVVVFADGTSENLMQKPVSLYYRYSEVSVTHEIFEDSMAVGLHTLISCPPDEATLDAPSTMMNDLKDLDTTLTDLLEKVSRVQTYVNQVKDGEISGDPSMGFEIVDALNSIPNLSADKFEKSMSSRIQNLLMLSYLSKLTRAQLNIGDKINQILHKTVPEF